MTREGFIKKTITTFLYFSVLYYLFPFSANYFYSFADSDKKIETVCQPEKKASQRLHFVHKVPLKRKASFVKDRSRFDLDCVLFINPSVESIEFAYSENEFIYVFNRYEISLSLIANRGPPRV